MDNKEVVLCIHTLDTSHMITRQEALYIKRLFGKENDEMLHVTSWYNRGFNEMVIEETHNYYNAKPHTSYVLKIQINPARMLGYGNVRAMPATQKNIRNMIKKIITLLKNELKLYEKNSNVFDWTIQRIDFAFDLKVIDAGIMIRILNRLFDNTKKRFSLYSIRGKPVDIILYETLYFGNGSYRYNIYHKLQQLLDTKQNLSKEEINDAHGIIRIEKQIFGKGVDSCIDSPRKIALLMDPKIIDRVEATMIKEINSFFHAGRHVSFTRAKCIIQGCGYPVQYQNELIKFISIVSQYGMNYAKEFLIHNFMKDIHNVQKQTRYFEKLITDLGRLDLSASGILKDETEKLGVEELPGVLELLSGRKQTNGRVRSKAAFGKIYFDSRNSRYKCNFTRHSVTSGSRRESYADSDRDKLELKILERLLNIYYNNLKSDISNKPNIEMLHKSMQDIVKFRSIARCKGVIKQIDKEICAMSKNCN